MTRQQFVARYGGIYEHSAWVAEQAYATLDGKHDAQALERALAAAVDAADDDSKRVLINAHPDLAGRAAVRGELTEDSTDEQKSAGIDQCSSEEFARFQMLNGRYREKFGFPFVMAVRNSNRHDILAAFATRLEHDEQTEFATAIAEIHKIARLRLGELEPPATAEQTMSNSTDNPYHQWVRLEQPRLGTRVVYATDEFFAAKERMIEPAEPVFIDGKYDDHGKWMDGWESRRKRVPGHDYCVVRLGIPGVVHGFDIDTRHFTGNYAPAASIDACNSAADVPADDEWQPFVARLDLAGDSHNYVAAPGGDVITHLRLNIFPDGGVARLRVFGEVRPTWSGRNGERIDLFALENGGRALVCSDEHYGSMHNLNLDGRGVNMGDGWETARRRRPGNDWVVVALGPSGVIDEVLIDTGHFKGNYPDRAMLHAGRADASLSPREIAESSNDWPVLLPEQTLAADSEHSLVDQLAALGPVTHVRLSIFPDGGISRIRLFGRIEGES